MKAYGKSIKHIQGQRLSKSERRHVKKRERREGKLSTHMAMQMSQDNNFMDIHIQMWEGIEKLVDSVDRACLPTITNAKWEEPTEDQRANAIFWSYYSPIKLSNTPIIDIPIA